MTVERRPRGVTYRSYNFIDKDPIIDEIRTLVGQISRRDLRRLEELSGVSRHCLAGWFLGATKRPQHATVKAVLRALGHDLVIQASIEAKAIGPALRRLARPAPVKPANAWHPMERRARIRKQIRGKA